MSFRIGFGVDYHQLGEGRELWIGGVLIPYNKGAVGHSDADVLLHALCDAMLGAACLGDIGVHFPDTDAAYKNIDSKILLRQTVALIGKEGYRVVNIDSTLCLQEPKIKPYVPQMQQTIAAITGLTEKEVSIKATTTEGMGFVGRKEGLTAYATILLQQKRIDLTFDAMTPVEVKIVNRSANPLPGYATEGAAGLDISAFLDAPVVLQPLERGLIPTGLFIELPAGYEAQIRPRSGLAIRQGLTCLNTPGTIDSDYRGEVKIILINLSAEKQMVQSGDRIAQMVVQKVEKVVWKATSILEETSRSAGGFGSTGKN